MAGVLVAALTAASFWGGTAFAEDTTSDITLSATVNSSTVKYKLSIPSGKRTIDSAKEKYNEVGTLSVTKFDGETVGFSNTKQVSVTVSYSGSLTNTDTSITAKNKLAYKLVEGTENSNTDLESGRTYSFSANDINGDSGKSVAIGAVVTGDPAQVENGTYEDKVTFTASVEAVDIEVTGVTINDAPAELNEGDTGTLTATVSPENATNKDVAWSSDNTSVLAINETTGAYEAKAAGTATITAAAGGKTATCAITVKSAAIAVTGITIDNAPTEALFVNSTGTLTATVSPDNATDKTVTWSSSDPDYVSINETTGEYEVKGDVTDEDGKAVGMLYVDFFPRTTKQSGAWMTSFREQYVDDNGNDVRPLVTLTMNFTRPTDAKPSLLTVREVETFMHEFGHALHQLLTRCKYQSLSGTNVYRDFVEVPSQFNENYVYERQFLDSFARHYQTGEPVPQELIDRLLTSSQYGAAYACVRQLGFGYIDMAWHNISEPYEGDDFKFEYEAVKDVQAFEPVDGCIMSPQFTHIFSGGYAAGYYGYKWAEMIECDAFSKFQEDGIFNRQTARSWVDNVLSRGGTEAPMTLYKRFRGREPHIDAMMRRDGITGTEQKQ